MTLRLRGSPAAAGTRVALAWPWAAVGVAALCLVLPVSPVRAQHGQGPAPSSPATSAANPATDAFDPDVIEALALHQQARSAIQQQQWAEAELLLERVLMLHPHHAEAMVDLAQLLAKRGREPAALAILQVLRDDERTPALQRQRLAELATAIQRRSADTAPASSQTQSAAPHSARGVAQAAAQSSAASLQWAELALGYGRNPLLSTSTRFITLTLPDGSFQLPLETRPRPATSWLGAWGWRGAQGHEVLFQAQQFDQLGGSPAWRAAWNAPWWKSGGNQAGSVGNTMPEYRLGTFARAQQFTDGSRRMHLAADLRLRHWGIELGAYDEPQRKRGGAVARLSRTMGSEHDGRWQATVWVDAEENRREGAPGYRGAGAATHWHISRRWVGQLTVTAQHDTRGYSMLLANNTPRHVISLHLAAEYELRQSPQAGVWIFKGYHAHRRANISLFEGRDTGVQVIWRYIR